MIDSKHAADLIEALGTIALWRPAYRASIIKLSRGRFSANPSDQSGFGKLKERIARRLEKRELEWTADDVIWLVAEFVLLLYLECDQAAIGLGRVRGEANRSRQAQYI